MEKRSFVITSYSIHYTKLYEGYEGPFVFKRGQKYYYLCSAEGYKRLIYYMADQPLGPWAYMGTLMEPDTIPSENNHCSVVEFNGEWILFYHQRVCGKARKVCADFLHVITSYSIHYTKLYEKSNWLNQVTNKFSLPIGKLVL